MSRKHMIAVLAVTMLTIPVALTGCATEGVEDLNQTSEVVVEAVSENDVSETIEEDLASEGIVIEDEDALDDSALYVGDRYCVGQVNVYAEPSESAEIVGTLADQTVVQVMGIHHVSQFYKASVDGEEVGYIRTVDLTEFGEYNEETDLVEEEETTETVSESQTIAGDNDSQINVNPDDPLGILEQGGFGDEWTHDPGQDEDFQMTSGGKYDGYEINIQ